MAKGAGRKRKSKKTTPEGGAQIPDPRQSLFLSLYMDPQSETFSNALQSALKAGYRKEYAENLLSLAPEWLSENIGKTAMLRKAERNLLEILDLPIMMQVVGPNGPIFHGRGKNKKPLMDYNIGIIKLKTEVSIFVVERLGRKMYGAKTEGEIQPLQTMIVMNVPDGKKETRLNTEPKTASSLVVAA